MLRISSKTSESPKILIILLLISIILYFSFSIEQYDGIGKSFSEFIPPLNDSECIRNLFKDYTITKLTVIGGRHGEKHVGRNRNEIIIRGRISKSISRRWFSSKYLHNP